LIIIGVLLPGRDANALEVPRGVLLGAGVITLGIAVAGRLRAAAQDIDSRIVSASLMLTAAVGVGLAYVGTPDNLIAQDSPARQWDSIRMFLAVLGTITFVGAFLVILPVVARKVIVSLLILLHFASIFVAVTSVPPPNSNPPWLAVQAWYYFFRPYSSFMYLNNAYHFYSPEPGPPTLAWFYVRYDDGSGRWLKLPSRKDSPVPMHFQRLLALTESINVINHNIPPDYDNLVRARRLAGKLSDPEIPLPDDAPPGLAYQPPEEYSKIMAGAYARYVARHWPHPEDNPDANVKTVKVYRLIHQILSAPQLAKDISPNDETTDLPYFMGEFNPKGELLDPRDPFLYFWLPIRWQPQVDPDGTQRQVLENFLEKHATSKRSREQEGKPDEAP
jgi:hypothetical protein